MTLKELRTQKKLTQEQVARLLDITRRTYIKYEQDEEKLSKIKHSSIISILNEYGKIDETHGVLGLENIKAICNSIFKDYSVKFCFLFGSYAKGKAKETSDIDLYVSMKTNGEEYYDLIERLREELKKKIDLIHETQLTNNLELTNEILRYGIKIYESGEKR